jgi:RNA polymerase sigma-70 factor (ECF subfamily)
MRAPRPQERATEFAHLFDDEPAFRRWYEAAAPRVYAYLYTRCGADVELTQELTQETFLQVVRNRESYAGRADSVTWLIAIARSRLGDHFRRLEREGRRHMRLIREIHPHEVDPDAQERPTEGADLRTALARLTSVQRVALVLRYLDGLSVREVAETLGRSEKTTEALITRARVAFRAEYEGREHG